MNATHILNKLTLATLLSIAALFGTPAQAAIVHTTFSATVDASGPNSSIRIFLVPGSNGGLYDFTGAAGGSLNPTTGATTRGYNVNVSLNHSAPSNNRMHGQALVANTMINSSLGFIESAFNRPISFQTGFSYSCTLASCPGGTNDAPIDPLFIQEGNWNGVGPSYIGVQFSFGGSGLFYGWIGYEFHGEGPDTRTTNLATITDFAYEDQAGVGILAGATGSSAVPVPATIWLFGSGLLGVIAVARRKQI